MKARLLSYNNAPVWQIGNEIVTGLQRRSHPLSRAARQPLLASDADLDARQRRRDAAPRRSVVSRRQAGVERRLRADGRARRQGGRSRRLGHAHQRQRHRRSATRRCSSSPAISTACARCSASMATMKRDADAPPRRRADGAGSVLRLPPLHARPEDDDQQQRDQAGQHARRHRLPGREALRRRRPGVLLPQRAASRARRSRTSCRSSTSSRTSEKAGLGMPMPAGIVRVYQADSKGGMQFVGEDRIDHTPKDETLNLKIGNAFDVVVRAQADRLPEDRRQRLRGRVRDHAAQPQGDADRRSKSTSRSAAPGGCCARRTNATKTAAWAAQFKVPVAADGTAVLKYRVRVTY